MLTIAIDAMGGDFGPAPIVEGTLLALKERNFKALLVGDVTVLKPLIPNDYLDKISFIEATDILDMHEVFASDGLYKDQEGEELLNVMEFFDGLIDLEVVLQSEIEAFKSDYHYCGQCEQLHLS